MFVLRGVSSNTLDIDVGAKKDPKGNLMDINGYRFELIPKKDFVTNSGSWKGSWIKDFSVEDGVTYLLTPLSADTTYLVRVASRNLAGLSDWSEIKEFTTLLKQPYVTSQSMTASRASTSFVIFIIFLLKLFN